MNFLILSAGRRTKLVEYFTREFGEKGGRVVATDCDEMAPAIYIADRYYIVPKIFETNYIPTILQICEKENIDGIISLIDPELELIAKEHEKFEKIGVKLFISPSEVCNICFDKYKMFNFLEDHGFKCAKTYISIEAFETDLRSGKIDFPVFVKPRCGSASIGINKVNSMQQLRFIWEYADDLIIQEFLNGDEYGADCYIDIISGKPVSIFVKQKLRMRSGETDKSVSVKDDLLFKLIEKFSVELGALGIIDIDLFKADGQWYISEVNPRFGGGYPHAHECGCDFPHYIINNINGIENKNMIGNYKEGKYMIKHDTVMIR